MSHRHAIGLITTFISGRFFEQVMSGIQSVARQHQADVLVIHGTPEQVALTQLGSQNVDGWLVLTYTQGLDLLAQQGKPIVTVSCAVPDQPHAAVFPDNRQGMTSIMDYLIGKGHRRIAFVGDTHIGDISERFAGYKASLKDHNIDFDPALVVETDNPLADRGQLGARELLSRNVPFTAVVAGNDWTAIGVMRELQAHDKRVPEDVAVVGFDDIPEVQITNPPLTTVRQHTDQLGATAAKLLISQILGEAVEAKTHYLPTTFVQRESSGNNLIERISHFTIPSIPPGPLWQSTLSRELVRILLPALPVDQPPSAAAVWPEVDKLVQLLVETIEGTTIAALDAHLLNRIFSSPVILNANSEILAEMLRVLESAGMALINDRADAADARQRLFALLDQLLIEIMRSYRRRQTSAQRTLSEILQSQYNISQFLLQYPPEQLDWLEETPMFSGCMGLWALSGNGDSAPLIVGGSYQRTGHSALRIGATYPVTQFPPLDLLPSSAQKNEITTALVLSLRSADHDWGVLVVSGPLISNDPWLEDNTINTLEICCGFLVLTLERQMLKESLRDSADNEQLLADRIDRLNYPVITVMDGVLLVPMAGMLGTDVSARVIAQLVRDASQQPTTDVFLDLTGVAALDNRLVSMLTETVNTLSVQGIRVTIIGLRPDLQQRMVDHGMDQAHFSQPSLAVALEQVHQMRSGDEPQHP